MCVVCAIDVEKAGGLLAMTDVSKPRQVPQKKERKRKAKEKLAGAEELGKRKME